MACVTLDPAFTDATWKQDIEFYLNSLSSPSVFADGSAAIMSFAWGGMPNPPANLKFDLSTADGTLAFDSNKILIRVPESDMAGKSGGNYSFELRITNPDGTIDVAFTGEVPIVAGVSISGGQPLCGGTPGQSVYVIREPSIKVVQSGRGPAGDNGWSPIYVVETGVSGPGLYVSDWIGGQGTKPAVGQFLGAITAAVVTYDDTVTQFGTVNVQGAIEALFTLTGVTPGICLDFSNPANFALGNIAGAI